MAASRTGDVRPQKVQYQIHTADVDGVVRVETVDETWVRERRFHVKIDRMADDALAEIAGMVARAKQAIYPKPKPDPEEQLRRLFYDQLNQAAAQQSLRSQQMNFGQQCQPQYGLLAALGGAALWSGR